MAAITRRFSSLLIGAALLAPPVANAGPWWGEASLGMLNTSGNSQTTSINGKFTLDYQQDPWRNAFLAQTIQSKADSESTAERYLITDKVDYTFANQNYAFLAGDFEKDLFGGIRRRTSETAGIGRHILRGPTHVLDLEIGGGARQLLSQADREKDSDAIARFGADYRYKLNDTSGFRQTLKVESGQANTLVQSVSELKLYVIGNIFAAVTYTVQYNSDVDAEIKHTDTQTALNFSYAFGEKPKKS